MLPGTIIRVPLSLLSVLTAVSGRPITNERSDSLTTFHPFVPSRVERIFRGTGSTQSAPPSRVGLVIRFASAGGETATSETSSGKSESTAYSKDSKVPQNFTSDAGVITDRPVEELSDDASTVSSAVESAAHENKPAEMPEITVTSVDSSAVAPVKDRLNDSLGETVQL